jgi:arginyl-tRNA synthetase
MRRPHEALAEAVARHVPMSPAEIGSLLETPPSADLGDLALPCFALAKELRRPPPQVASELSAAVELPQGIQRAAARGPYVNFFLDRQAAAERVLGEIRRPGWHVRSVDDAQAETFVVEYSSPNIAKHLGVHHLPGTLIGRTLCRILRALGHNVVALNFLGDWGTGFGKLIAAVERYGIPDPLRLTVSDLQDLYVRYSADAADDPALEQAARDAGRRLEEGEERARACWEAFKEISLDEFEHVYAMLGVQFDRYMPESLYADRLQATLQRMTDSAVARESDGALVVDFGEQMPSLILRRSDGTSLYSARDIAAAEHRWDLYHFDHSVYVVGNEQALYLRQLQEALKKMGHHWADRMVHVNFGLIKFLDQETGRARVGSTRGGDVLLLKDLLDEAIERARAKIAQNADRLDPEADLDALAAQIGVGAVVFALLSSRRTRDMVFDWDRVLDFEGNTGPYVQYAHARLCSILRKAGEAAPDAADLALLALPEEWAIVRHLERFPAIVRAAGQQYEPSTIASYLLELCADFSAYYSAGMRDAGRRVLCPDGDLRAARLVLVDALRVVVRAGLDLLGIAAPERM